MSVYLYEMESKVGNLPCIIGVTYYHPADPGRVSGPPERCYPPEPMEMDFDVLTEDYEKSPDLEKLLTDKDRERIESEFEDYLEEKRCENLIAQREDEEEWYPYR